MNLNGFILHSTQISTLPQKKGNKGRLIQNHASIVILRSVGDSLWGKEEEEETLLLLIFERKLHQMQSKEKIPHPGILGGKQSV